MTVFHFILTLNYFKILIEIKSRVKSAMKLFLKYFKETFSGKKNPHEWWGNCNTRYTLNSKVIQPYFC
jgi:hypothetical protein